MPTFIFNCVQVMANPPDMKIVKTDSFSRKFWVSVAVISYFSAICDPWVYAIRMRDFRMALKELLPINCKQ